MVFCSMCNATIRVANNRAYWDINYEAREESRKANPFQGRKKCTKPARWTLSYPSPPSLAFKFSFCVSAPFPLFPFSGSQCSGVWRCAQCNSAEDFLHLSCATFGPRVSERFFLAHTHPHKKKTIFVGSDDLVPRAISRVALAP